MPVRLAEVARHAGVSEATASRVLSGRGYVSAASRDRVASAVAALDYIPHPAARALSRARTATVALLVHHAQYPPGGEGVFASRVVHGVTRGLREAGIDLLYVVVDDDAVARLARLPVARASRSDGLVILGPAFPEASIRDIVLGGRPVVLVDNCLAETPVAAVMADNRPASEALTTHLIVDHGYERIACFAGPPSWPSTAERVAGYRAALATHGLPERIVHAPETTLRDGAALADRVADDPPDAIVAISDAMAIGALQRMRARADRPAIVGFDDIGWARLTDPPLTTVAVDAELMGARAAWLLLERLDRADSPPPAVIRIPATPRLRGSCGCPAAAEDDR